MKTQALLKEIFDSEEVRDEEGNIYPLKDHICPREGKYLQELIRKFQIKNSLEIGLGYGISSLYICEALLEKKGSTHLIIDTAQKERYKDIGLANLKRTRSLGIVNFIRDRSEFVLPSLLKKRKEFDLILIDGDHSFEGCFLDFIYSKKLLEIGGILVFDDCEFYSINKIINYAVKDPQLEKIGSVEYKTNPPGEKMISFRKIRNEK